MNSSHPRKIRQCFSKGFTLVEVLITVAILAIIMGLIGTLFISGSKAYSTGQQNGFVQSDTRLAMEIIQKEIRYASKLELISSSDIALSDTEYDYIVLEGKKLLIKRGNGEITSLPGEYLSSSEMDITGMTIFSAPNAGLDEKPKLININLAGKYKDTSLLLSTSINLLNMTQSGNDILIGENQKGYVIKYSHIPPVITEIDDNNTPPGDSNGGTLPPDSDPVEEDTVPYYNSQTVYNDGDKVMYNGKLFIANWYSKDSVPGNNQGQWTEVTDSWSAINVYQAGAIVTYNGEQWRAKYYTYNNRPRNQGNNPWEKVR